MRFEGPDDEWLVIERIRIPAVFPLSYTKNKERLYALPGGYTATAEWIRNNEKTVIHAFKTHRPKVCEYPRG